MAKEKPTLFQDQVSKPLAEILRPRRLEDVAGQGHLLGAEGILTRMVAAAQRTPTPTPTPTPTQKTPTKGGAAQGGATPTPPHGTPPQGGATPTPPQETPPQPTPPQKPTTPLPSLIFWGPPGTGKTTIARLLAARVGLAFEPISAVFDGVADLRAVFARAEERRRLGEGTLLFVDEVHRFNKAQQDGLLSHVEDGRVILVGATTENPSFALNGALLSRAQVLVLNRLDDAALEELIARAEAALGRRLAVDDDARAMLRGMADGDGRYLLNMVETIFAGQDDDAPVTLSPAALGDALSRRAIAFDRAGDEHYNLMSALHKSLRASDADAGLYWLARMFHGGEDPHYILRRLVRFASEDIGLAEPEALPRAIAAWHSYERLGTPEGELAVANLVLYLATAPKSNAGYKAFKEAMRHARETGSLMPPKHILNAPTGLMKDLGYGAGYVYDHDAADGFSGQNCFPDDMARQRFYHPIERGYEREIKKRLDWWEGRRQKAHDAKDKENQDE